MQAFADVDYVLNLVYLKSICRYVFIIFGDIVCFSSTKQRFVTSFIIEAEDIVLSLTFQQAI